MKPINLENNEDNIPTSSNCIILGSLGVDCSIIDEGNLGVTVTNALEQMIYLSDTLNINTYKARCFDEDCNPRSFEEVFQLVMDAVCNLEPEEVVTVCNSCIIETDDCVGSDISLTMEINDYVNEIALRLCSLEQVVINSLLLNVSDNEERIKDLENADTNEIQFNEVLAICSLNPQTTDVITLTKAFEKMLCFFTEFHGEASTLDSDLNIPCEIFPTGHVPTIYQQNDYASILEQLWDATCLLRIDLVALKAVCCGAGDPVEGCLGENFEVVFSRDANQISLDITGSLTAGYIESGSFVTVTDINGLVYTENVIVNNYTGSTFVVTVPNTLDLLDTFIINIEIITLNVSLGSIPCSAIYTETLYNIDCGNISNVLVSFDELAFSLIYNGASSTDFVIELTDGITTFTNNITIASPSSQPLLFSGLNSETDYTLTVTTLDPNSNIIVCGTEDHTTLATPCITPSNLSIDLIV
jgi:hypothetical protein